MRSFCDFIGVLLALTTAIRIWTIDSLSDLPWIFAYSTLGLLAFYMAATVE